MVRRPARRGKRENRQNDTTKPAFSPGNAAWGLFGQGKMVYNKYILGIKGRTIMYQKGIKRLLDVVLSACGLLVLSPLLLLLCLAIKLGREGSPDMGRVF